MIQIVNNLLNMIEILKMAEWIDRYNEGDLSTIEHRQFSEMISRHPVLRAEVKLDQEIIRMIEDEDVLELVQKLEKIRKSPEKSMHGYSFLMLAASILALTTIGLFTLLFIHTRDEPYSMMARDEKPVPARPVSSGKTLLYLDLSKTTKRISPPACREMAKNRQLIARYQPLPELELLIGSSIRADAFHLFSPQPRLSLPGGSTILFQWDPVPEISNCSLEIIDNTGKVLSTIFLPNGDRFVLDTDYLGKGLIYWKLIMDEEIISLGSVTLM